MHARAVCLRNVRVRTVERALSVCVLWCLWSFFFARGVSARLSPLAEADQVPHPRCSVHQLYKRDSARRPPEKGRWSVEGGGETQKARLCTQQGAVLMCTVLCLTPVMSCGFSAALRRAWKDRCVSSPQTTKQSGG